jgi:hypothetical protein
MTGVAVFGAVAAGLVLGCSDQVMYRCTSDDQCVDHGAIGICAPQGFCAFPSDACAGGYQVESGAPEGTAGACITSGAVASCIDELAFGRRFGCVLKTDHSVWCAGDNDFGQLGTGTSIASPAYVQVVDDTDMAIDDATAIGLGHSHACVVRMGGSVWCWGRNSRGQIGNGAVVDPPPTAGVLKATQVIKVDGTPLVGMTRVHPGNEYTCALGSGRVWCWGDNSEGHLGDGRIGSTYTRSKADVVLASGVPPTGGVFIDAVRLQLGRSTACAQRSNNETYCWGSNDWGEIRAPAGTDVANPALIGTWPSVAVGRHQVCRVDVSSKVLCTGRNIHGLFGTGATGYHDSNTKHVTPVETLTSSGIPFTNAAQIVIAGGGAACVIGNDTNVYCWGDGMYGQTATGTGEPFPALAHDASGEPLRRVDRLIAQWPHVCIRKPAGEWLCWGKNLNSEFGDGTRTNRRFPAPLGVSCP